MQSVACKNDSSAHLHFLIISPYSYFNSFLEHNSETIRNISMILGGFIVQVNTECRMQEGQLCLSTFFKLPPLIHIFRSFSEHNCEAIRNIIMILGRITEQVSAKSRMQE